MQLLDSHFDVRAGHFELLNARDNYRAAVGEKNMTRFVMSVLGNDTLVLMQVMKRLQGIG